MLQWRNIATVVPALPGRIDKKAPKLGIKGIWQQSIPNRGQLKKYLEAKKLQEAPKNRRPFFLFYRGRKMVTLRHRVGWEFLKVINQSLLCVLP